MKWCNPTCSQSTVLPPCLCASVRVNFFLTEARRHRVPDHCVCRSRSCRDSLSRPTGLTSSPVAHSARRRNEMVCPLLLQLLVPPCLCASVRVTFFSQRHGATEFLIVAYTALVPAQIHCRAPAVCVMHFSMPHSRTSPFTRNHPELKTQRPCKVNRSHYLRH